MDFHFIAACILSIVAFVALWVAVEVMRLPSKPADKGRPVDAPRQPVRSIRKAGRY